MSNLSKKPIKYYKGDAWNIVEEGFDPNQQRVSESIFSLANEYMGTRGYFEEGYTGDHLLGSYFNHLYVYLDIGYPQVFKGFVKRETGMVNAVDWLYTRLIIDGEQLDLAASKFSGFKRTLDMKNGLLLREFVWETHSGKQVLVNFSRFTNISNTKTGGQQISIKPLNFSGEVELTLGLDFNTVYELASGWDQTKEGGILSDADHKIFWVEQKKSVDNGLYAIQAKTVETDHQLFSSFKLESNQNISPKTIEKEKFIGVSIKQQLKQGKTFEIKKTVLNYWEKSENPEPIWEKGNKMALDSTFKSYNGLLADHKNMYSSAWESMVVDIDGDPDLLQGIIFSTFHNYQTYHCESSDLNALPKGLTGEIYAGWIWWDSETFVLRFQLITNPEGVKNMLLYRYKKLSKAMERACDLGVKGAKFPMASITGTEDCGTWQHVDLEVHVNGAVFYGIWQYVNTTLDKEFLYKEGIEMLIQINRCNASWGEFGAKTGKFGLFGVMGPDEHHMMVNNNCYTNFMAKKSFEYALETMQKMKNEAPDLYKAVAKKTGLSSEELEDWRYKAKKMKLPRDEESGIFEQHDGYFDLPHVELKTFPNDQIPIVKHWPYIKIFRYNIIKQPDVLNMMYFFSNEFTHEVKLTNYDYYEERTLHESSLSPSVHGILAIELGKLEDGYDFTEYASRLDLDNYNRNTEQGLHVTAASGAWSSMLYGWAGMRIDGDMLEFNPVIWKNWNSYSVRAMYRGALIELKVDKHNAVFTILKGKENIQLKVYGNMYNLGKEGAKVKLMEYWNK